MAVQFKRAKAHLSGHVSAEEAEPLGQWVLRHPKGSLDLADCESLHAAALQVLLALRPRLAALPADPWLAAAINPVRADHQV
jgi:hypothetical protein